MLYVALIFCLACGAFAQTPGLGRCPNVDTLEIFDENRYEGMWYENKRNIPNHHDLYAKCTTANFSRIDSDLIKIVTTRISTLTGHEYILTGAGTIDSQQCVNSTNCGKFIFEFPIGLIGHERSIFWIIDTDYTSYTIVWSCTDHFLAHTKYLWIYTRDQEPSDSTLEQVTNVLLKNKIDNVPLMSTDQKNCP